MCPLSDWAPIEPYRPIWIFRPSPFLSESHNVWIVSHSATSCLGGYFENSHGRGCTASWTGRLWSHIKVERERERNYASLRQCQCTAIIHTRVGVAVLLSKHPNVQLEQSLKFHVWLKMHISKRFWCKLPMYLSNAAPPKWTNSLGIPELFRLIGNASSYKIISLYKWYVESNVKSDCELDVVFLNWGACFIFSSKRF